CVNIRRHLPETAAFPSTTLFRSLDDPVGAIDRDPLRIVGNAGQVQMGHADPPAARQAEGELDAAALVEEGTVVRLRRQLGTHMRSEEPRLNSSHVKISYAVSCLK